MEDGSMKSREIGEVSLTVVFLALAVAFFSYHQPAASSEAEHACCLKETAAASVTTAAASLSKQGQNPGQEEEGNPTHTRPKQSCNHNPTAKQVQCHCATDCKGNGSPSEDRRCKSFCFKDMCSCPRPPCP